MKRLLKLAVALLITGLLGGPLVHAVDIKTTDGKAGTFRDDNKVSVENPETDIFIFGDYSTIGTGNIGNGADPNFGPYTSIARMPESVYDPTGVGADVFDADNSKINIIGAPDVGTVQGVLNANGSAGWVSGNGITDNGNGTIDIGAGEGYIKGFASNTSVLYSITWPAFNDYTIPVDTTRYFGVEYNAGSPQVVAKTTFNFDGFTEFIVAIATKEPDGDIHEFEHRQRAVNYAGRDQQRTHAVSHIERDNDVGGLIVGETGTRSLTLTAGQIWVMHETYPVAVFDSSTSLDSWDQYYRDGGGGWTKESDISQWNNLNYDDGDGGLGVLGVNKYAAHTVYIETDGHIVLVYGQTEYNSAAEAITDTTVPATLPIRLQGHSLLTARLVFKQNDATLTEIQSAFATIFTGGSVTDHGDLAGLADNDHPQYALDASFATHTTNFNSHVDDSSIHYPMGSITSVGTLNGFAATFKTITSASYTVLPIDYNFNCDDTNRNVTFDLLPIASTKEGQQFEFTKTGPDGNKCYLDMSGAEVIEIFGVPYTNYSGLDTPGESIKISYSPTDAIGTVGAGGGAGGGGNGNYVSTTYARYSSSVSDTGTFPFNDTYPEITGGSFFMGISTIPANASNDLYVSAGMIMASSVTVNHITCNLFRDSIVNSIGLVVVNPAGAGNMGTLPLGPIKVPANAAIKTVFQIRCGGSVAGTIFMNRRQANELWGTTEHSHMNILEVIP